ncbi:vascular endothelial growth factor B isoform X2 [Ambystoma mexicanum]|uniref:vascular endothelial growth factor B isoform X2 n=1 Tax=Ambystoma mexicanum TaxID=8296 RepID=UPI0037E9B362
MGPGMVVCSLLLASLVHCTSVKPPGEEMQSAGEVIKWIDVYNRSYCQPKELLVDIAAEYPEEVEHIFLPSCVPLRRCAGCCVDEELECVPNRMHVVIMQIMKTKFLNTQMVEVPFVEHSQCECRPKKHSKLKPERPRVCGPCQDRRKQQQDPLTCECSCKRSADRCRAKGQELNEHTCKCENLRR